MIKKKTKFLLSSTEENELGAKKILLIGDGKTDENAYSLNLRSVDSIYNFESFANFIERRNIVPTGVKILTAGMASLISSEEGWTSYSTRLATLSPAHLNDEQLSVVIAKQAEAEKEYDRSYKGIHFVDGGKIDIDNMEKALAANKKIFIDEQVRRAEQKNKIAQEKQQENQEITLEENRTKEFGKREEKLTDEINNRKYHEAKFQKEISKPLVDAQNEANRLKSKELNMAVLDINEFKALDVIVKYQLQDPQKFDEFVSKFNARDPETVTAFKTLQKSLQKKYQGQMNFHSSGDVQAGVNALISENAKAIEEYAKAQEAIHTVGAAKAVPAQEQNLQNERK